MIRFMLLLCMSPLLGLGQTSFSYANIHENCYYQALATNNNDRVALAGWRGKCHAPYLQLISSSTGTPIAEKVYPTYRYGWYTDVCMFEEKAWAVGKTVYTDDEQFDPESILAGHGALGNILFQHEVADEWAWESEPSIHPLPGGSVLWNTGSKIYTVSQAGELIDSILLEAPIEYIGTITDSTFLLKYRDSISVDIWSMSGEIIQNLYQGENILAVANTESNAYVLTEEEIIGWNLESFASDSHTLEEGHLFNELSTQGELALCYTSGLDQSTFSTYSLEEDAYLVTGEWYLPWRALNKLKAEEGIYYLIGRNFFVGSGGPSGSFSLYNGYLQAFNTPEDYNLGADLGVATLTLELDTAYIIHEAQYQRYVITIKGTAKVVVQNFGTTPFDGNFLLIGNITQGFNCWTERYYELHSAQIEPGAYHGIEIDIEEERTYWDEIPLDFIYDQKLSRCYFTAAPNSTLDAELLNNRQCEEVLNILSSTEEPKLKKEDINIYPNPVSDQLTIDHPGRQIKEVELLNMQGREVYCHAEVGINNTILDLHHLPAGVYTLLIYTSDSFMTKKVLIE